MGMQALENRGQTGREQMLGERRRQTRDDGFSDRQADTEFKQKSVHLVDGLRTITHERFALDAVQKDFLHRLRTGLRRRAVVRAKPLFECPTSRVGK